MCNGISKAIVRGQDRHGLVESFGPRIEQRVQYFAAGPQVLAGLRFGVVVRSHDERSDRRELDEYNEYKEQPQDARTKARHFDVGRGTHRQLALL